MKHLPLSLWSRSCMLCMLCTLCTLCALSATACDAAVVASAQQDDVAAPGAVELQKVEHSEKAADDAAAAAAAKVGVGDVKATIEPEALDLESINFLVKKGKVKDAAALEKKINDPKEKLSQVDVDGDGKLDKIQVVEIQKPNQGKVFELHVIPSKSKNKADEVIIAYIHFEPDVETKKLVVKATYAPIVIGHETIVYEYFVPIEVKGETIVVVESHPFYGWLFLPSRPVFVGVYVYTAPPPPVIIIEHGWHGKYKGKGKGKWH